MTAQPTANVVHYSNPENDLEALCEHPKPAFLVDGPGKEPKNVAVYVFCERCVEIWNTIEFIMGDGLFPKGKPYRRNAVLCEWCGGIAESRRRHERQACRCGRVQVDGGLDYLRRVRKPGAKYVELSENADGTPAMP